MTRLPSRTPPVRRLLTAAALAAITATTLSGCGSAAAATLDAVVDGDTISVHVDGGTEEVRLIHIDTPEVDGPDGAPECLAAEAKALTEELLADGEPTIELDEDARDDDGTRLAGVTTADGRDVSEELARAGLGTPRTDGSPARDVHDVIRAGSRAQSARLGMFDSSNPCTPAAITAELAALTPSTILPTTAAGLAATIATTGTVIGATHTTEAQLEAMGWLTPEARENWTKRVNTVRNDMVSLKGRAEAALPDAQAREAEQQEWWDRRAAELGAAPGAATGADGADIK